MPDSRLPLPLGPPRYWKNEVSGLNAATGPSPIPEMNWVTATLVPPQKFHRAQAQSRRPRCEGEVHGAGAGRGIGVASAGVAEILEVEAGLALRDHLNRANGCPPGYIDRHCSVRAAWRWGSILANVDAARPAQIKARADILVRAHRNGALWIRTIARAGAAPARKGRSGGRSRCQRDRRSGNQIGSLACPRDASIGFAAVDLRRVRH